MVLVHGARDDWHTLLTCDRFSFLPGFCAPRRGLICSLCSSRMDGTAPRPYNLVGWFSLCPALGFHAVVPTQSQVGCLFDRLVSPEFTSFASFHPGLWLHSSWTFAIHPSLSMGTMQIATTQDLQAKLPRQIHVIDVRVNPRTRPSTCASCPRGRAMWSGRTAPAMRRGDRAVRREPRGPPTVSSPPSDWREGRGIANRGHPAPRVSGDRETDGPEPASWQCGSVPPRGPHGPLSLREKNGPCIEGRPLWTRNRHVSPPAPKGKSGLQYPPLGGPSPGEQGNLSTRRRDVGSCAPLSPRSHVSPFLRSDWSVGNTWGEDDRWQGIQQPSPVPFLSNADDPTSDRTDNRTSRFPIGPIRGGARDRCRGFVPSVHRYLPSIIDIFHRYLRFPPGPPRLPCLSSPFEPERPGIRSPIDRGPSRKGSHRFPAVLLRSDQKSHRVAIGARAIAPPSFARASSTARDVVRGGKSGRRGIERGAPCPMPETRLTTRGA